MSHPTKLATFQEFAYAMSPAFESELRELRARGLIEPVRDDVPIAQLKREGDLKHYFRISARGRRYLTLLNEAVADASAPSSAR